MGAMDDVSAKPFNQVVNCHFQTALAGEHAEKVELHQIAGFD
jgi:hypothetical protein